MDWHDDTPRYNPVIWIVNHERELPAWLLAGNESIRRIAIPMPDIDDRHVAAGVLARGLLGREATAADLESEAVRFAEQTQGMTMRSMLEIVQAKPFRHRAGSQRRGCGPLLPGGNPGQPLGQVRPARTAG